MYAKASVALFVCLLGGQNVACAQAANPLAELTLSTWTTQQGLPQNFITALDQTNDGFLWVGTMGGLARFDGLSFRTSFAGDAGIHANISSLAHDRNGDLWVGTASGLYVEHRGVFHSVALPEPAPMRIEKLLEDAEGNVWLRTRTHLWRVRAGQRRFDLVLEHAESVHSFALDQAGNLWCATGNELERRGQQGRGPVERVALPGAKYVLSASDGRLYAGDNHKLYRYNDHKFVQVPRAGAEEFVSVATTRDGAIWMASGGLEGVSRRAKDGTLAMLSAHDGLAANDARVLYEGRDGAMWIGTISGLQRLRRMAFTSFRPRPLADATTQFDSIFQARDGAIWTGTLEEGIARFAHGNWTWFGKQQGVRAGQLRGFAEGDTEKPVVAVSDYGLFRWERGRYRKVPNVPEGYVTSPLRTHDGSLWVSVLRQGVVRLQGARAQSFAATQGLTDLNVWCLFEDRSGRLWAGTGSGVFRFDGTRWEQVLPQVKGSVLSIAQRADGTLILGLASGMMLVDGQKIWRFTRSQGLPADTVLRVVEDRLHALWIVTSAGLCRFTAEQIQSLQQDRGASVNAARYTEADGLPSRDLLPLSQANGLLASDGRVWFATERGPAAGSFRKEPAPVAVADDVAVDGVLQGREAITIAPGRHRLTFTFTAPEFIAAEQLRFRYRLEGWDTAWIDAGMLREASYAGLPPGRYRFLVQAIGRGDVAGPVSPSLPVELRPFFWQTRWFVLLVLLFGVALAVELTRRWTMLRARGQARKFEERATERERIAYQIHDTVIQDLIGATLHLEIAEMELASGEVDPHQPLEGLAARLRETIARSRSMVANLHSTALPEYGLVDVLRLAEAEFRLFAEPEFRLECSGEPRELEPLLREDVYRICREAIANAFRHAQARHLEVLVYFGQDSLEITIADDGVGMESSVAERGRSGHFGLPSMRARAERIGARMTMVTGTNQGTRVHLLLRSSWWRRVRQAFQGKLQSIRRVRSASIPVEKEIP
ncbi:MAG: two-component regulator propeller domain-containing protein [Acidobacteriaceae bacterium]|nr:two-component regulator propeller domain-containing protein [Acidobacteriaceae bacterium]